MLDRKLKKELKKVKVPAFDAQKLEDTVLNAKKMELCPEKLRMTNMEFIFDQMRFIKKETWVLKISFSIFMIWLLLTESIDADNWFWTILAISGPLLCLINVNEICNVFQAGMLEIQMTAKNSFSKVLMIRLIAFGLFDLCFFTCMAAIMSVFKETALWQIILYSTVPYIIMCFGCMLILNRCRDENQLLYSGTWGICLCCAIMILKISGTMIFEMHYVGIWLILGAITTLGMIVELRKLLKRAGGNLNEINYGTAV